MGGRSHSLDEVLAAIERGITMAGTARVLGVPRSTVWRYAKRWKAVEQALNRKRDELVDYAETGLRKAVLEGQPWAIALTLKTLGKHRGYTERIEHTGSDGAEIRIREVVVIRHEDPDDPSGSLDCP